MDSSADSVALRSDCANAQADLELHWPHMSEDPFLHDAAHMIATTSAILLTRVT